MKKILTIAAFILLASCSASIGNATDEIDMCRNICTIIGADNWSVKIERDHSRIETCICTGKIPKMEN